jgi:hypothetical protein
MCSDAPARYQVELVEATGKEFNTERPFYYQVVGNGTYAMKRVSTTPDPKCGGTNLLDDMATR